jgi:hypothetical protein
MMPVIGRAFLFWLCTSWNIYWTVLFVSSALKCQYAGCQLMYWAGAILCTGLLGVTGMVAIDATRDALRTTKPKRRR